MTRRFELVIFDWDGTLIDSEAKIVDSMQSAMRDVDLPVQAAETISNIIGLGMREALDKLLPDASEKNYADMIDRYRYHFFTGESSQPFAGVGQTLEAIYSQDYFLAVATGKGRNGLDKALDATGFKQWFHATRCADETRSKPHPQMLEEILDVLAIAPDKAVMIGDTEYDLEMAQHAGMSSVAVSYGVHETERLMAYNPETCIHSMPELIEWLSLN